MRPWHLTGIAIVWDSKGKNGNHDALSKNYRNRKGKRVILPLNQFPPINNVSCVISSPSLQMANK